MEKRLNILLVDDHRLMADGLKSVLETQPDFNVVATAHDMQEALRCCNDFSELDLIVMDINLSENGPNGLELTRQIKNKIPKIKVLILSMHDEIAYLLQAKQVGANGYVSKSASGLETVRVIREVGNGNDTWPLDGLADMPVEKPPTPTEMQVLKYIVRGLTTAQIGIELAMLETTVSAHRHNIMQKYNLQTQGDLFKFANKCMALYGIPPDPKFSAVVENYRIKFKEKMDIDLEFDGETDGFNNAITQALSRVIEGAWNAIKHRNSLNGAQRAKNISIKLKRDSAGIRFTIRANSKDSREDQDKSSGKSGNDALERILKAIGGELSFADSGNIVIATLPARQHKKQSLRGH